MSATAREPPADHFEADDLGKLDVDRPGSRGRELHRHGGAASLLDGAVEHFGDPNRIAQLLLVADHVAEERHLLDFLKGPLPDRSQWLAEVVATSGLGGTILGLRLRADAVAWLIGLCITAAYCLQPPRSLANPAGTIARSLTDSFSGIPDGRAFVDGLPSPAARSAAPKAA